eukprot:scaffold3495_cov92-Phaeocystis_antarctica.AAC.3
MEPSKNGSSLTCSSAMTLPAFPSSPGSSSDSDSSVPSEKTGMRIVGPCEATRKSTPNPSDDWNASPACNPVVSVETSIEKCASPSVPTLAIAVIQVPVGLSIALRSLLSAVMAHCLVESAGVVGDRVKAKRRDLVVHSCLPSDRLTVVRVLAGNADTVLEHWESSCAIDREGLPGEQARRRGPIDGPLRTIEELNRRNAGLSELQRLALRRLAELIVELARVVAQLVGQGQHQKE